MATLYTPGMTIDQFRAKLQADPGFQQVVRNAARLPNGQFTPQGWLAISRYAGSSGLNDLNLAQIHSGDPHRSTYSIDGNGGILEQHDGKGPEFWGPIIVGAVAGGAIAAPYLGVGAGAEGAAGATTASGTTAAGTTAALGPSTAGNIAATSGVVGGSSVPAALSVGTGAVAPAATAGVVAPAAASSSSAVPWGTIVGAGTSLFGNLFAAHEQSAAADRAAEIAAAGSKYSADLQAKANADTLKFQYANSENAFQNSEAARQGNYGIFAARERRLGTIGEEVGLGPREIPAYVPGVDPGFGTLGEAASGGAPPAGSPPAAASGNPGDPSAILAALTDNYKSLGVTPTGPGTGPTDIAYMAKQMAATGGLASNNASYWLGPQGRIAQELAKARGGGPSGGAPSTAPPAPGANPYATSATPYMNVVPVSAGVPQNLGYYA